ncbi:MAG: histidine kinase [Chloroflexota bacterium]|nr:histidine kinase [Chloroflexota bacterium]
MRRYGQLSLRTRIAAGVFAGLAVLVTVFGLLALRAISLSTTFALEERLHLAQISAEAVDDLIDHTAQQFEQTAAFAATWASEQQQGQVAQVYDLLAEFERIARFGPDGALLWEVPQPTEDARWAFGDDATVRDALGRLQTTILVPARGPASDDLIAILVTPLDRQDAAAGFLAGELRVSHADVSLLSLPEGEASLGSEIVDADGYIVFHSGGEEDFHADEHVRVLAPMIAEGRPGTAIHHEANGPDHVVAYYPFRLRPGGFVVEQTEDAALVLPQEMQRIMLVYGIGALLAASVAAWLHATSVVRPIRRLTGDAARMASGDLDHPIAVSRGDEIGELASRFDEMRVKLRTSLEESTRWAEELEHRVELRAREADERNRELHALNRIRRQLLAKTISAQEEERKRLARDLHDDSAQTLTAVLMSLSAAEGAIVADPQAARASLARSRSQLEMALTEIRKAIVDLRPSALDDLGLASAIRSYAEERLRPGGIKLSLATSGDERRARGPAATAIFRIIQEAVSNAAQHSAAANVRVSLDFERNQIHARVEDDGSGFDPASLRQPQESGRGLGLLGMRERAELFGGDVEIESRPGAGTSILVRMPLG